MGSRPSKGQIISVQPARQETPPPVIDRNELIAKYHGIFNAKLHNVETRNCKLSSGVFLPNGGLILCDQSNSTLKLFNRFFKYESHLILPGKPHDVCIYSFNSDGADIYVTLPRERTVLEIYVDGNSITLGDSFKTENWCYGITAYKEGLLITVGTKLKFIDINSQFIKNIDHRKIGESPFGSPCYLEVTKNQNILISDSLKSTLCCIDADGREIFRYNKMRHPHGIISIDNTGLCLTGKCSPSLDVLHQLSAEGAKVKSLLTRKRIGFTPLALCYRPADRILVIGGESDRIKAFKLLPMDFKRCGWTERTYLQPENDFSRENDSDYEYSDADSEQH